MTLSIAVQETWALLIGMGNFKNNQLPPIPAVSNNLTRLQDVLSNPEIMGIPPDHLIKIENQENLRSQVSDALGKLPKLMDTLIIYYVGHGIYHPTLLYLASAESKPKHDLPDLAFEELWKCTWDKATNLIYLLDCCFSGNAMESVRKIPKKNIFVLTASSPKKPAEVRTDGTYTAFTGELLEVLEQGTGYEPTLPPLHVYDALKTSLLKENYPEPWCFYEKDQELRFAKNRAFVDPDQTYRQHVVHLHNRLSLMALPEREPKLNTLPLDKVFVKLKVVLPAPPISSPPPSSRSSAYEDEEERMWEHRHRPSRDSVQTPPSPISIATALKQYRHLIILGAPGSGKSTLLRWLAVTFAQQQHAQPDRLGTEFDSERLPILLELRRFAGHAEAWCKRAATFDLAEEISQWLHEDANFPGISAEWVSHCLRQHACLILLDGLDELTDLETRQRLLESLEALSQNPHYEKVQCILTSRFHGFQHLALGPSFQRTEIHPFDEDDIEQFIQHWYDTAYPDFAEQAEEARKLIAAINNHSGVKALAQNPLLCTILAVIYRHYRSLPHRRIELYEQCCETLLDTWERNKAIKDSGLIGKFDWKTKLELLMPVAHDFHEKGALALPEEKVVEQLAQSLDKLIGKSDGDKPLKQQAREFLAAIRDRSGLLQGRGDGTLEFMHRTFQEYLTARYLAQQEEENCIDEVMTHLHQEWWREVHLLVIGHLGSGGDTVKKATQLLLTILNKAYPPPNRWLMPPQIKWTRWFDLDIPWQKRTAELLYKLLWWLNLSTWCPRLQWSRRLAWSMLREFELVAQAYAECTLAGRRPISNALSDFAVRRVQWPYHRKFLLNILREHSLPREEIANFFIKELSHGRELVRRKVASSLGDLGQASESVLNALIQALHDKDDGVRWSAAKSLGHLGQASEAVLNALIQALRDQNNEVRESAVENLDRLLGQVGKLDKLGQTSKAAKAVLNALIEALRDQQDRRVHWRVTKTLILLGRTNETVLNALIEALRHQDKNVRESAAWSLGRLGQASETVLNALIEALRDQDKDVRESAASSLNNRLDQINETAHNILIEAFGDRDNDISDLLEGDLGLLVQDSETQLVQNSEAVPNTLIEALWHHDKNVRERAAESLGDLGQASETVLNALIQALQDQDDGVRRRAVESLGRLGQASEAVLNALIDALRDQNKNVRIRAVESLDQLGQASESVINALIQALQDQYYWVCRGAAENLGKLKIEDETQRTKVFIALQQKLYDPDLANTVFKALRHLLEGKQIPGYRWHSSVEKKRERWVRGIIWVLVLFFLVMMLYLGLR